MPVTRWLFLPAVAVIALVAATRATSLRTWHPTLSSVSPSVLDHGANLTISGTDLAPPGWQRRLIYRSKYFGGTTQVALNCCSTPILVAADKNMRGDSVRVEWVEGTDTVLTRQENPIPQNERVRYLPAEFVVQGPPDLTFEGTLVTADIGPSFRVLVASNGFGIVKGKYLRVFSMPTIRFGGNTVSALAHTYEPQGWLDRPESCCSSGADRVVFPLPTQKTSGWLVLDNTMGKDSGAVTFALPPAPTQVVQQTATGTAALAPANTLQRGRNYSVRGQNLSITHTLGSTTSVKRGAVQLGGVSIAPTFASDTNIVFTVPTSFTSTSVALSVSTPLGTAQLGTFSIVNPPVPISVVSLTPTITGITPGKTISVTANLTIPADAPKDGLGNLVITAPGAALGTLKIKSPIPVKETSVELQFSGGDVQVTTPVTLVVAHESNGVGGITTQTQQMTFNVRPPHPTGFSGPSTVIGGSSQAFDVLFDSSTKTTTNIFALLSSSNPNIVAVPASATISGSKATFTATVPPAPQAGGTATITATLDGATVSLPLTVVLPQMQQATVSSASILPGDFITVGAVLNGALASTAGVSFTSSDTALKRMSNTYAVGPTRTTAAERFIASQAISQSRQATVTASYAGTSKTATVTINPIVISSFTATPSSAAAGTTITATALLSSAPGNLNMKVEFASADTMRATVSPTSSELSSSATSKVVSILLKGPVSTPRQVPITATLRVGSANPNPIVSTQTIVVTVNP